MNKVLLYFYILSSLGTQIYCQDLPLVVDTTLEWSVLYGEYYPNATYERTEYLKIQGDSTIDNINYKMIYRNRDPYSGYYFDRLLIREYSQKVYLLDNYSTERVLYDFSLEIGDTIKQQNMFDQQADWIIDEIDSIEIEGTFRKQLHLIHTNYGVYDTWIEGIGSTLGLVTPGNFVIDFGTELLCVKKDLQNIYTNPIYDTCFIYYIDDPNWESIGYNQTNSEVFKVFPNPVKDKIYIQSNIDLYSYQLYDIADKIIKIGELHKNSEIDVKDLEKGFYIITIYNQKNKLIAKIIKE